MSRIGKQPIILPEKVEVKIDGLQVKIKGPKGNSELKLNESVKVQHLVKENKLILAVDNNLKNGSLWGTYRTILNNMVVGVSEGFTKKLNFNGVGYKASVSGNKMTLGLGYSHPIEYSLPQGVSAKVVGTTIELYGSDKELLGFTAAQIRSFRPPEPYKGKGVKYEEEVILRKAGKTGGKK